MNPQQTERLSMDTFLEGIWRQNPVFVMMLGMCPTLAVTVSAVNALSMGVATAFVLVASALLVSLLRRAVPKEGRIATYIVIIATFVTVVDYAIQAISLALYDALGAFIQLIVVNCIILGRAEAHSSKHPPMGAMTNALGMGGTGTLFGFPLFGPDFQPWVVMVLPPGGFFVLAAWLLLFAWFRRRKERLAALAAGGQQHGA